MELPFAMGAVRLALRLVGAGTQHDTRAAHWAVEQDFTVSARNIVSEMTLDP